MPAKIASHPMTMANPMDETIGNAIARIPQMINTIDNTIEVPVARFNPVSSVAIIPPCPALSISRQRHTSASSDNLTECAETMNLYTPM
jgi:hypothetical protein